MAPVFKAEHTLSLCLLNKYRCSTLNLLSQNLIYIYLEGITVIPKLKDIYPTTLSLFQNFLQAVQPQQISSFLLLPKMDCVSCLKVQRHLPKIPTEHPEHFCKARGEAISIDEIRLFTLTFPKSLRFASGN